MKRYALLLSILVAGCAAWMDSAEPAAPPTPKDNAIEVKAEPSHHLVLENSDVRVFKVEVGPDASTLKHRHTHDYVTVTFGAAQLSNEVTGKEPVKVAFDDGEVRFSEGSGPSHLVHNIALTTFRNLTIELLQEGAKPGQSSWEEDHGVFPLKGGTREILFARGGARVSKIELEPGGVLAKGQIADRALFVALTNLDLREEKNLHPVKLAPSGVKWDDDTSLHTLTNRAKETAKIVLIELK